MQEHRVTLVLKGYPEVVQTVFIWATTEDEAKAKARQVYGQTYEVAGEAPPSPPPRPPEEGQYAGWAGGHPSWELHLAITNDYDLYEKQLMGAWLKNAERYMAKGTYDHQTMVDGIANTFIPTAMTTLRKQGLLMYDTYPQNVKNEVAEHLARELEERSVYEKKPMLQIKATQEEQFASIKTNGKGPTPFRHGENIINSVKALTRVYGTKLDEKTGAYKSGVWGVVEGDINGYNDTLLVDLVLLDELSRHFGVPIKEEGRRQARTSSPTPRRKERWFGDYSYAHRTKYPDPIFRIFFDDEQQKWLEESYYSSDGGKVSVEAHPLRSWRGREATDKELLEDVQSAHPKALMKKMTGPQALQALESYRAEFEAESLYKSRHAMFPHEPFTGRPPISSTLVSTKEQAIDTSLWARCIGKWGVAIDTTRGWDIKYYDEQPTVPQSEFLLTPYWEMSQKDAMILWNQKYGGVFPPEDIARAGG